MIKDSARGLEIPTIEGLPLSVLLDWMPEIPIILEDLGVHITNTDSSLKYLCDEAGVQFSQVLEGIYSWGKVGEKLEEAKDLIGLPNIDQIRIETGLDKEGRPEAVKEIEIKKAEIVAIVGPTGSGKSQLLFDIESLASGDTVTNRRVYLNGNLLGTSEDTFQTVRPIAHISQKMNFILDLSVNEFLDLHIEYRQSASDQQITKDEVIKTACQLCGEPFFGDTLLVSLSGGQSRALMIADAVLISQSPIVLIDEIENAGIDKEAAVDFLTGKGEITFLATHDPIIALKADKRLVLKNGAIQSVVLRTEEEGWVLQILQKGEKKLMEIREKLRQGELISI